MRQALPNKRVLVVAHENITNNYYAGNNRSCLVSNCLFRVGGAACMLSNKCAPGALLLGCGWKAADVMWWAAVKLRACCSYH